MHDWRLGDSTKAGLSEEGGFVYDTQRLRVDICNRLCTWYLLIGAKCCIDRQYIDTEGSLICDVSPLPSCQTENIDCPERLPSWANKLHDHRLDEHGQSAREGCLCSYTPSSSIHLMQHARLHGIAHGDADCRSRWAAPGRKGSAQICNPRAHRKTPRLARLGFRGDGALGKCKVRPITVRHPQSQSSFGSRR